MNIYILVESEARQGKEPDNEGQRAFRGTLEIRLVPFPRAARRRLPPLRAPLSTADSARPRGGSGTAGAQGTAPHGPGRVRSPLAPSRPGRNVPTVKPPSSAPLLPRGPSGCRCVSSPDAAPSPARSPPAAAEAAPSLDWPLSVRPSPAGYRGKAADPGAPRVPASLIYSVAVQDAWKRLVTLVYKGPL
ncbi:cuticle collagen 13-like [Pseudopipra pipra]|uniref:cuticle collagen 13-like n=1 Tax=Pseudopipra pipra TaxID=415032 RepID=UPI00313A267D